MRRATVIAQIDEEDAAAPGETTGEARPVAPLTQKAVQDEDRGARAQLLDGERDGRRRTHSAARSRGGRSAEASSRSRSTM